MIDDPACHIVLKDGVLYFRYRPQVHVDLVLARRVVNLAATLVSKPHPTLVDTSTIAGIDRPARVFLAGPENHRVTAKAALLVHTRLGQVIANFFMGLNKPPFPTRMFADERQALAWLRA